MATPRKQRHAITWAVRVRKARSGVVVGVIPGVVLLAVLVGIVPQSVNLQAMAFAYLLYFLSLPIAAYMFRLGLKARTLGFAIGVAASTVIVLVLVVMGAAAASAS